MSGWKMLIFSQVCLKLSIWRTDSLLGGSSRSDRRSLIELVELYRIHPHSSRKVHCVREKNAEYLFSRLQKKFVFREDSLSKKLMIYIKLYDLYHSLVRFHRLNHERSVKWQIPLIDWSSAISLVDQCDQSEYCNRIGRQMEPIACSKWNKQTWTSSTKPFWARSMPF